MAARITRSSTVQADAEGPTQSRTKKRKRSANDKDVSSNAKHLCVERGRQQDSELNGRTAIGCGDRYLSHAISSMILTILERYDSQGLLDRVFPITLYPSSSSTSHASEQSQSFRALLEEPEKHPLRVLRSAAQHLYPISTHRRSRPNSPAAHQRDFGELAEALLDEASAYLSTPELSLNEVVSESSGLLITTRKFALMQKLPSATWWSSLNAGHPAGSSTGQRLGDLNSAHAEMVAILPSPEAHEDSIPTLGSISVTSKFQGPKPAGPRRVHAGSFLDYGLFASFAPTFDQGGAEIGRVGMSALASSQQRSKELWKQIHTPPRPIQRETVHTCLAASSSPSLSDEISTHLLEQLCSLADQHAVERETEELLQTNSRLLTRLAQLQTTRLTASVGSGVMTPEEVDTAEDIMSSLSLLISLRPRAFDEEDSPVAPAIGDLRRVERTLPTSASTGWHGTMPNTHPKALRDDMTVFVRSGVAIAPTPVLDSAAAGSVQPQASFYMTDSGTFRGNHGQIRGPQYSTWQRNKSTPAEDNAVRLARTPQNEAVPAGPTDKQSNNAQPMAVGNTLSNSKLDSNAWPPHAVPTLPLTR